MLLIFILKYCDLVSLLLVLHEWSCVGTRLFSLILNLVYGRFTNQSNHDSNQSIHDSTDSLHSLDAWLARLALAG